MTEPITAPAPSGRSFPAALHTLRAAQKSSVGAPAYSRFVNRPLGRILAAWAYTRGLTPDAVTGISASLTLAALAVLCLVPPPVSALVVPVLLVAGYAFDSADGQLARLLGGGRLAGEWLDHMVDAAKSVALHLAVLVCWHRFLDLPAEGLLLIPLGYAVVSSVFFFGMILTDLLRRAARRSAAPIRRTDGPTSLLYALAVLPVDYGFLCVLFLALLWPPLFVAGYSALLVANLAVLLLSCRRWRRELLAIGAAA